MATLITPDFFSLGLGSSLNRKSRWLYITLILTFFSLRETHLIILDDQKVRPGNTSLDSRSSVNLKTILSYIKNFARYGNVTKSTYGNRFFANSPIWAIIPE